MHQTSACILLLLSLSATSGKYVHIKKRESWHNAQKYCRLFYTDLAPVTNIRDMRQLQLAGGDINYFWIGLERNSTDSEKWTWSGGGEVSTFFWAENQPHNRHGEDYGMFHNNTWHDATRDYEQPFFCYSAVVVRERKTWEDALEYCREHHSDLASVVSDTEMMLIQKELRRNDTTDRVWIGLHFFSEYWRWVDRQPLSLEAWGQDGKPECPKAKMECAALQVMGGVQRSNSTNSTLVTNATPRAGTVYCDHTHGCGLNIDTQNVQNTGGNDTAVHVKDWVAYDCEEKLHFICY